MRSLGCQHTDVVFNIKHTVADGISNGNANGPFRNDFTSPVQLLCIIFLEVSTIFLFNYEKKILLKKTLQANLKGLEEGGDILSHQMAVPSALMGLTSLFGMGRGEPHRYNHLKL